MTDVRKGILILGVWLAVAGSAAAQHLAISYSPANPNVEQTVTFTSSFTDSPANYSWQFGDGATTSGYGLYTTTHAYTTPNSFAVTLTYYENEQTYTATTMVTVTERRSITYSPGSPTVNQPTAFTAQNFLTPGSIYWNFGDGTSAVMGTSAISHTYTRAGTFPVTARDNAGKSVVPISTSVTVQPAAAPWIECTPHRPYVNDPVEFTAYNFQSTSLIRWDFDDGTVEDDTTPPSIIHVFRTPGSFNVRAYDAGGSSPTAEVRVTISLRVQPAIAFSPSRPRVNEIVSFTAVNFLSTTLIRWDFADGTVENDTTPPSITHIFRAPGTYVVRAYDGSSPLVFASVTVEVSGVPAIMFTPPDPRAGEDVLFTAVNFLSTTLIRWNFGDGTIENDTTPPTISHVFRAPGTFVVQAFDGGGGAATAAVSISIAPPRSIIFQPKQPRIREPIIFQGYNFVSGLVRWNFGDGTPVVQGGVQATHAYDKAGVYTVVALDSRNGVDFPVMATVRVSPAAGPLAPFGITYVNLRFEDGTVFKTFPKNFLRVFAYADIKYEGTGLLQVQWKIDGQPFRTDSRSLTFADQVTIDSGQAPPLPTVMPGLHEVKLEFIQPLAEFNFPVIRYYVMADDETPQPMTFIVTRLEDLYGQKIIIAGNSVEAQLNRHFLLTGKTRNGNRSFIPFALLQVQVDDETVDRKLLTDLKPNEEREFTTSVLITSDKQKTITVALYDLTPDIPALVYSRTYAIVLLK